MNVTLPVAVDGVTVAVKMTESPYVDVGDDDAKFVVVAIWYTVRERIFDVDV
jgi:hypothetical protein